jgi:hypothetical protein
MSKSSFMRNAFIGTLAAVGAMTAMTSPFSFAAAQNAPTTGSVGTSLQPGCYPAAQVRATLRAEGQEPVIVGNRVTTRRDRPAHYFTSNARGEGYQLEGDQSVGTPANTICVNARVEGLQVNDITSNTIPAWALIGNDRDAANANCRNAATGPCESHDDYVRRASANGQRVMLVAHTVFNNPDGSTRNGRMITVLTQVDTQLADVKATNAIGASESVAGLEAVNYTQFATRLMAQNTNNSPSVSLASLRPPGQ